MGLSPQQKIIIEILRDQKMHCGREWLDRIKDDRRRIIDLNRGYMKEKGFVIKGYPCDGRCGRNKCPLYMRRAEKIPTMTIIPIPKPIKVGPVTYYRTPQELKEASQASKDSMISQNQARIDWFNNYPVKV